jgi:hypothetical protein
MPTQREHMPRIEVLVFDGCRNAQGARELVDRVVRSLGLGAIPVEVVVLRDDSEVSEHRFLGSPTIRVDGLDIAPRVEGRTHYVLSCRVYNTTSGPSGLPDEAWLREALTRAMH